MSRDARVAPPRRRVPPPSEPPRPRGHLDALPLIVGYVPFGLMLGAAVGASSVPALAGWATSPLIFAGASQLALLEVLDGGGTVVVAVATALAINLRHVVYSAGLAPWLQRAGPHWRWAAPLLLNDPQYLMVSRRFPELPDDRTRRRYYLELGLALWVGWSCLTGAGMVLGARLPGWLPLDTAVPLTFLALLVPALTDRPAVAAAVTGGTVAVLARGLPLHLGLLAAVVAGVTAGTVLDTVPDREHRRA